MRLLIVTGADESFATLLRGLVESLFQWGPLKLGELAVLDVGLAPATLEWLRGYTSRIVAPGWDLPVDPDVALKEPYQRSKTARAFLPRHFPGYDMYLWLDADMWVQEWFPIEWFVQAAAGGKLAAVPQIDRLYNQSLRAIQWRLDHLRWYFGETWLLTMLSQPYLNSGAFALRCDAPHWESWQKHFRAGLAATHGKVITDQTALNYAVVTDQLPVSPLPARCNWCCHLALPEYRTSDGLFCEPGIPGDPIGIVHMAARTKDTILQVKGPDGKMQSVSLRYDSARRKPKGTR